MTVLGIWIYIKAQNAGEKLISAYTNEWYVFGENTIDKKTCNKIKRLAKGKWKESSVNLSTGNLTDEERKTGRKAKYGLDRESRISNIFWTTDQWVYDLIWPFMKGANDRAGWKYQIESADSCQLTRYQKGGFYNFHTDGKGDHLSAYHNPTNDFLHGCVRKLSMSIMLNDNFDGGAFEFASYGEEECAVTPIEATAGSIIVFPSAMEHRVAPVTKGIRYSLVIWFLGPPFK